MKIKNLVICCFSSLLIIYCASTNVSRFKSTKSKGQNDSLVDIRLFSTRIEPAQAGIKNILLLGDHAQARFIEILHKKYSDDDEKFQDALKRDWFGDDGELKADYVNKDLKMVFSISKTKHDFDSIGKKDVPFSPADRIEYLRYSLKLDSQSNLIFTKWNRYITEYDTLSVADMTFKKTFGVSATIGVGKEAETHTQIKPSIENTMEEKQNIHYRHITVNGCISDSLIEIEEEGARDIDLAGNVIADVSVRFPETPIRVATALNLLESNAKFNIPESTKLRFDIVNIPSLNGTFVDTIRAYLSFKYYYRHVEKGYETFYEWDDEVAYYYGNIENRIINLFYKTDYLPKFYFIRLDKKTGCLDSSRMFVSDAQTKQEYFLVFKNYVDARNFTKWLINYPIDTQNGNHRKNNKNINKNDISNQKINIQNNFTLLKKMFDCDNFDTLRRSELDSMNLRIIGISQLNNL